MTARLSRPQLAAPKQNVPRELATTVKACRFGIILMRDVTERAASIQRIPARSTAAFKELSIRAALLRL
ncbi:MAG: hypothetical protein ACXU7D_01595 [Burkholderiaceae bacterium]